MAAKIGCVEHGTTEKTVRCAKPSYPNQRPISAFKPVRNTQFAPGFAAPTLRFGPKEA